MALGAIGNIGKSFLNSRINNLLGAGGIGGGIEISLQCGGDVVKLPVIPESYSCRVGNQNESINIINAGEYLMMGKTGLKTITLECFFPAQEYNFALNGGDPWGMVDTIDKMRLSGEKIDLIISGSSVKFPCLIDEFEYGERDGSGDVYYSLSLREYREVGVDPKQLDAATGLNERKKLSFMQKTGLNLAKNVMSGQPPLQAISSAFSSSGLTGKQQGYLAIAKAVTKKGGLSMGDAIGFNSRGEFQLNGVIIK